MSRSTKAPYVRSSTDGKRKTHAWKKLYNRVMRRESSKRLFGASDCEGIVLPVKAEHVSAGDVWNGPRDGHQVYPGVVRLDDRDIARLRRK